MSDHEPRAGGGGAAKDSQVAGGSSPAAAREMFRLLLLDGPDTTDGMDTKRCRHCREYKPATDFPQDIMVSDGLSSWCRSCHNEATRAWRARKKAEYLRSKEERHLVRETTPHGGDQHHGEPALADRI
jgi:hypothetical protein